MKAINIKWDVLDELQFLSDMMEVPNGITDEDWLSDITGFCHKGFELVE